MEKKYVIMDGNEAASYIAYKTNELCAIYPITPASSMGELADEWSAKGIKNIWGNIPQVTEMQSEAGAAGFVHGALQAGTLSTTFTASQGLLLMLPNMFKIAGELTPTVFHIAARSLATHALSIFGDHSDVMAARSTGYAMLFSDGVQEAHDMAMIAHAATLRARIPFMHIFDGFRTSHELLKIELIPDEVIREMIDERYVVAHRKRALNPNEPVVRGTAQNADVFFQGREAANLFYQKLPHIVQDEMDKFAQLTGRHYNLFDYVGDVDAERVIVIMGSGSGAVSDAILNKEDGWEKVGMLNVRLYRPFSVKHFLEMLPDSVKTIAVLDRTKEPGAVGEPLYQDVVAAMTECEGIDCFYGQDGIRVIGGRYGLSSKEFTPAMAHAVFEEMKKQFPKKHFTVGINDDVTNLSLSHDENYYHKDKEEVYQALFYGLGADGTVGANKNTIKIIGTETEKFVQGYFVYDSKKSGTLTVSHLRFSNTPIRASYLIDTADFIACHQFNFLTKYNVLEKASDGAIFLLNAPYSKDEVWEKIPHEVQAKIIDKNLELYVVDANKIARETGMANRVNTILQTCFFAISGIIPRDEAIQKIKDSIYKTFIRKGEEVVNKNFAAVDNTLEHLYKIDYPKHKPEHNGDMFKIHEDAPDFVHNVLAKIMQGHGDQLPVSALPVDGTFPTGTTKWEKRFIATTVPVWNQSSCTQCAKCMVICPHSAIRAKVYDKTLLENAPGEFKSMPPIGKEFNKLAEAYTLQVSVDDCTGCTLCVEICPVNDKEEKTLYMADAIPLRDTENKNWDFFLGIPEIERSRLNHTSVKGSQFLQPLFEFSGACTGCGETPYVKLLSQLFGDRMIVANATGCSSIYGGNLPTTPWTTNSDGRGPAWSNSLFEDNAEFGLGIRKAVDFKEQAARELLLSMKEKIGSLADELLNADQSNEELLNFQRERIVLLREVLKNDTSAE
ncbi:MAG: pyruvate:ferredoxin (flavodoxin) oxidoreductase, partial [Bacteroidia bacterium]